MHPAHRSLLLALGVFAAISLDAQTVTEEIEVRVINVDVIVTNRSGAMIPDLKREDFQLFEDGKPIEIKYFSRISDGEMQLDPEPGQTAAAIPDEVKGVRTPTTWVVFIDQTNMRPQRRNLALRQLQSFFETALEPGDKAMVASIDGQAFRVRQNVTEDRRMILGALKAAEKERVHNGPAMLEESQLKREISRAEPEDREYQYIAETLAYRINFLIQDEVKRTRNAITAMGALLDLLSRVDDRVALMYVGAGFNTLPGSALEQAWQVAFSHLELSRTLAPSAEFHRPLLEMDVKRLFERLSGSRITLYTISPGESGLPSVEDPGLSAYATVAGARATESEVLGDRAAIAEASVGREMAARTGGLMFKANSSLARQLGAVRKDFNDYYSLGYVPTGDPGRTRSIRVKVNAPGARLRYREAARERTRWEEAGNDIVAALVAPHHVIRAPLVARNPVAATEKKEQANPLGIEVEAEQPHRDLRSKDHLLPFKFNMQLDSLTFQRRGSTHTAHLVFRFALAGPDGTMWPLESREQLLTIPQGEVPANVDAVAYSWHLDLGPLRIPPDVPLRQGGMKLNVSVEDRSTNLRSVIVVPVPKPGRG
jgi:VWFA-related protein